MQSLRDIADSDEFQKLRPYEQVDRICDEFEKHLLSGDTIRIEDVLTVVPGLPPDKLVQEMLGVQLEHESSAHGIVDPDAYRQRFENYPQAVDAALEFARKSGRLTAAPDAIPNLRIKRLLGKGAGGSVYLAQDLRLDREVAVKIAHRDRLASSDDRDRFEREARNVAQLSHPGIVPVYEIGDSDLGQYIVSEYVKGRTLKEELNQRQFDHNESAAIVEKLALALAHAHEHGIVHRDIKPANVMVQGAAGEGEGDDKSPHDKNRGGEIQPRLLDFGLSTGFQESDLTRTGQVLGTPSYMSPEQARGEGRGADARSDVYALGIVLYELLTGNVPFKGTMQAVLSQVANGPVPNVRKQNPNIARGLATICEKAVQTNPSERYQTAAEFATDLRAYLDGGSISARPTSSMTKATRWVRSNSKLAAASAMCAIFGLVCATALMQTNSKSDSDTQAIERLYAARIGDQADCVESIRSNIDKLEPTIRNELETNTADERKSALLRLALLPKAPEEAETLLESAFKAKSLDLDFRFLRSELAKHQKGITPRLWDIVHSDDPDERPNKETPEWLGAAALLAEMDSDDQRWNTTAPAVADRLVSLSGDDDIKFLAEAFDCQKDRLSPLLREVFTSDRDTNRQRNATLFLLPYLANEHDGLCDLIAESNPQQFELMIKALSATEDTRKKMVAALNDFRPALNDTDFDGNHDEAFWKRAANLDFALARLEPSDNDWSPFRFRGGDPRLQTYTIHGCVPRKFPMDRLVARIPHETDNDALYGLILALGTYDSKEIMASQPDELMDWMWKTLRSHSDAGIHASIAWFLNHTGHGNQLRSVQGEFSRASSSNTELGWYYTSDGQLMIKVQGPKTFFIGSKDATSPIDGPRTSFTIPWSFSVSANEVSTSSFTRDETAAKTPIGNKVIPEIVEYCDSLSKHCGLPAITYPVGITVGPPAEDEFEPLISAKINLSKTGYRLPTDAEWEYIARGLSETERFFGSPDTRFEEKYAWCNKREGFGIAYERMPNRLGFFDVLGNVFDRTLTPYKEGGTAKDARVIRTIKDVEHTAFISRGGSHGSNETTLTSATRIPLVGKMGPKEFGFRIARTHN